MKKTEWVKVCGVSVPKYQLEEAEIELGRLMEAQERAYLQMQKDVQDPNFILDSDTLLNWAQIFKDNGKPDLAELALKRSLQNGGEMRQ